MTMLYIMLKIGILEYFDINFLHRNKNLLTVILYMERSIYEPMSTGIFLEINMAESRNLPITFIENLRY